MAGELGELREIVGVVGLGIGIAGIVAIPWREIDSEAKTGLARGVGSEADEVAFAVEPGAGFDGVVCVGARKQSEPVVMFGDKYGVLRARCPGGLHPLIGVDVSGVEDGGRCRTVSPLAIQEGIGGKVQDDTDLEILPLQLCGAWLDVGKALRRRCGRKKRDEKQEADLLYPDLNGPDARDAERWKDHSLHVTVWLEVP